MVDQQKIVVTTTLLFSFYPLAFGRFFHFGSTEHPGKNDTKQRLGQDCPNEGGGGRRGFIEAINVCVREKGSRHTKYHVIESYRA